MASQPKWSTPGRKACLVKLWIAYGNRCLLGHTACSISEHYTYKQDTVLLIPEAKTIPCADGNGNAIRDSEGNQLYLTIYPLKKVIESTESVARLYDLKSEAVIDGWKSENRELAKLDWLAERQAMHSLGEPRLPVTGRFNNISQVIFHDQQPLYYLEGLGMSGVTLTPFAKIRLGSSYMRLYIDLGNALRGVSKNKRRKALRYGKPLGKEIDARIHELVWLAVKDYLNS